MKKTSSMWLVVAMGLAAGEANANYTNDFNAGIPAEWMEYDIISTAGYPGSYATFSNLGGAYRIEAAQSPDPAMVGGARAIAGHEGHTYSDVTMTWDLVGWDDTATQIFGGVARAKEVGPASTDGYGFVYGPKSLGTGGIDLIRFDNEQPTDLTDTVAVTLDPTHDYRFAFSLEGTNLTGKVYDLTTGSATPVASISAGDSLLSEGVTGLLVANSATLGDHIGDATFDNVGTYVNPNYADDFYDAIPDAWMEYDPISMAGYPGGPYATFSNPGGAYRIEAAQSPAPGTVGGARALSFREDYNIFTDVIMSWDLIDWDETAVQIIGGTARAKEIGPAGTDGYAFVYGPNSLGTGGIDLLRFDNEQPTELATTVAVTLDPTHDYRFIFTLEGPSLAGAVYDLTTGDPLSIATISAVDASYTEGLTGLMVANSATAGGHVGDATFDNASATDDFSSVLTRADLWIEVMGSIVMVGSTNLTVGATNALWVTDDLTGDVWSNIPPVFTDVTSTNWTVPVGETAFYRILTTAE